VRRQALSWQRKVGTRKKLVRVRVVTRRKALLA
jgi:hypothetical protein